MSYRKQCVHIQGTDSKTKSVTCGVQQGSLLDPPLFIIYVNDLSDVSNRIFPIADDTTNLIELHKLNIWLNANKLSIHVAKHISLYFIVQGENNITIT